MSVLDRILGRSNGEADRITLLESQVRQTTDALRVAELNEALSYERLSESIGQLELALEDVGWQRLRASGAEEFSRDGIRKIIDISRLMFLKNPLIRRAIMVQSYYVFGQGVQVQGRHDLVNKVIQRFWTDPKNRAELSDHAAQEGNEQTLQHDGNLFIGTFIDRKSGKAVVRLIPVDEITEVIRNPQDRGEPWYYRREWTEQPFDLATGRLGNGVTRTAYYPDWRIFHTGPPDPLGRTEGKHPDRIGDHPVETVPIFHVKVGGLRQWAFGLPDVYAALDWARAYKTFLESWHSIVQSLSRFAWQMSTKSTNLSAAKAKISTTLGPTEDETNPPPIAGSVFIGDEDTKMSPIPKTGATISADDGLALRKMVAAGTDIPDSILANDPQQGALATAKTLDRPTELAMRSRQMLWQDVFRDLFSFVIELDLRSTSGILPRTADRSTASGVTVGRDSDGEEIDLTVDVVFPPVLEQDRLEVIKAIVTAYTLDGKTPANTLPSDFVTKLLLVALEVEDVDELVAQMFPDGATNEPGGQEAVQERFQMAGALRDLREALRAATGPRKVVLSEQGAAQARADGAVMVGYFLPPEQARELAIPGGEPAEELHITLGFLGTADELGPDRIDLLTRAVGAFAAEEVALNGSTTGYGRFELGTDADPVWAAVDVPGLDLMRSRLVQALAEVGLGVSGEHGFTPHITLAFAEPGSPSPVATVPEVGFTIDRLTVAVGGQRTDYQLGA